MHCPAVPEQMRMDIIRYGWTGAFRFYSVLPEKVPDRTIGLKVFMDSTEDFTHMQVFTPKGKPFFCVEKQTCSTDVFNLDAKVLKDESHLIVVPSHTNFKGSVDFSYEFYNK